jgi:hypothetical protein
MRLVERPITVEMAGGRLSAFYWRKQRRLVSAILEYWADSGAWWEDEAEKIFYRLLADDGGLYELYRERLTDRWYLYKVYD